MSWRTSPPANRRCCCVVWCVVIANRRRSWARLKGKVNQRRIHLSLCFCFYNRRLTRLLCVRSTAAYCCELLTTERCATGCAPLTLRLPEHQVSGALTAKVKGLKPHSDIFHCVFQVKVFTEMSRMDEEESWMLQHNLRHLLKMVLCVHVVACLKPSSLSGYGRTAEPPHHQRLFPRRRCTKRKIAQEN